MQRNGITPLFVNEPQLFSQIIEVVKYLIEQHNTDLWQDLRKILMEFFGPELALFSSQPDFKPYDYGKVVGTALAHIVGLVIGLADGFENVLNLLKKGKTLAQLFNQVIKDNYEGAADGKGGRRKGGGSLRIDLLQKLRDALRKVIHDRDGREEAKPQRKYSVLDSWVRHIFRSKTSPKGFNPDSLYDGLINHLRGKETELLKYPTGPVGTFGGERTQATHLVIDKYMDSHGFKVREFTNRDGTKTFEERFLDPDYKRPAGKIGREEGERRSDRTYYKGDEVVRIQTVTTAGSRQPRSLGPNNTELENANVIHKQTPGDTLFLIPKIKE